MNRHSSRIRPADPSCEFYLNGRRINPPLSPVDGEPDAIDPADLIEVAGVLLTVGRERELRFSASGSHPYQLFSEPPGGSRELVAARVAYEVDEELLEREWREFRAARGGKGRGAVEALLRWRETSPRLVNPLSDLTDDGIRRLRGVRLDYWDDAITEQLQKIDPRNTCVTIAVHHQHRHSLPELPSGLRYLRIEVGCSPGVESYRPLLWQRDLAYFRLHTCSDPFDVTALENCHGLKHVSFDWAVLMNPHVLTTRAELRHLEIPGCEEVSGLAGALGTLRHLRRLNLEYCGDLPEVSWVAGLSRLRELRLDRTAVRDLTPIGGLKHIESVSANASPVGKLGAMPIPSLRELKVMSTRLGDAEVSAFSRSNPQCRVYHRWTEVLQWAISKTDRVHVRTGSEYIGREEPETLFDERDADRARELVASLCVEDDPDPDSPGGANLSMEFYEAGRLLATVGLSQGKKVLWQDGWPGDGSLTAKSRRFLSRWLSERGISTFDDDREEIRRNERAEARRLSKCTEILPGPAVAELEQDTELEEVAKSLETQIRDGEERARLGFKLYGRDERSWDRRDDFETLAEALIGSAQQDERSRAATGSLGDLDVLNGIARCVLERGWLEILDVDTLLSVLPVVASAAVASPREVNRRLAIQGLGQIESRQSVAVLRDVLEDRITPRPLAPEQQKEGGGISFSLSHWRWSGPDQAGAALSLAELGDYESLPGIRRLKLSSGDDEHWMIKRAVVLLDRRRPRR